MAEHWRVLRAVNSVPNMALSVRLRPTALLKIEKGIAAEWDRSLAVNQVQCDKQFDSVQSHFMPMWGNWYTRSA